jgi:hypothetical protein
MNDWIFENKTVTDLPEDCTGFVYLITNTITGRKYIGKKLARFKRSRPPLKGRKNKRRYTIESDWQTYYGSNDELNNDVAELGEEKFTREILYYCKTKSECSYIEAREQFARGVLETSDYYNGIIQVKVHGKGILGINKTQING